jgi:hypothetical protein
LVIIKKQKVNFPLDTTSSYSRQQIQVTQAIVQLSLSEKLVFHSQSSVGDWAGCSQHASATLLCLTLEGAAMTSAAIVMAIQFLPSTDGFRRA